MLVAVQVTDGGQPARAELSVVDGFRTNVVGQCPGRTWSPAAWCTRTG